MGINADWKQAVLAAKRKDFFLPGDGGELSYCSELFSSGYIIWNYFNELISQRQGDASCRSLKEKAQRVKDGFVSFWP